MGRLSATMKAELAKGGPGVPGAPEVYELLEVTWPDQVRRYARQGVSSAARGLAEGRVLRFGTIDWSIDTRSYNLQAVNFEPELADADRAIGKLISKYPPAEIRRCPVTARLVSPNVPDADSFVDFTGVLDTVDLVRPFVARLRCRPDDSALQNGKNPKVPFASFFASISDDARNAYAPVIYGKHDSNGAGNAGFVPAYLVDTVNNKWALALGHLKAVPAVYEDGTVVSTSDYTIVHEVHRGVLFTLIHFDGARTGAITADVEGLTANPDGTGAMLTNWDAVQHWLVNFVYGDWRNGSAWLSSSSAPIDTVAVTAIDTFLDLMGHEHSMWIGGTSQSSCIQLLNNNLQSAGVKGFWTNLGKLSFGLIDHRPPASIYIDDPWHRANSEEFGEFSVRFDPQGITRETLVGYVPDHSGGDTSGELLQKLRLMEINVPDKVVQTLDLLHSAARVV